MLDFLDPNRYTILPNTAGCFTAEDALRTARLGRELLEGLGNPGSDWVKLEVLADTRTLLPDPVATLEATFTEHAMETLGVQVGANDYVACREVLISAGKIRRGRGRGGSVVRVA